MAKHKSPHKKATEKQETVKKTIKLKDYINPKIAYNLSLFVILILVSILTYEQIFSDKFFPRTFIGDSQITFLTKPQAVRLLTSKFDQRTNSKLSFVYNNQNFKVDLSTASATLDLTVLDQAFDKGHNGAFIQKAQSQLEALFLGNSPESKANFSIDKQVEIIAKNVQTPSINAQLIYNDSETEEGSPSADIQIIDGKSGFELDQDQLKRLVSQYLISGKAENELPVKISYPLVDTVHVEKIKQLLEKSLQNPIALTFENETWILDTKQLLAIANFEDNKSLLNKEKAKIYLQKIASEIDQPVQEGLFEFNPQTGRVSAFESSQEGRKVDIDKALIQIEEALTKDTEKKIALSVEVVKPKVQTSEVNNLGIKELIGQGVSHFAGSIPNRAYNVGLTAQKISGTLIPPGEIFSFNQTVGDISAATGFKQAYVIKEGRTVLDDGGGVCQDSTTLFRAALNTGLPIVKRTAHAYRVGYYEQGFPPGLDATIYYPSVDFQFKNDTPAHILIQARTVGTTLYIDLYGTSDGRTVDLSRPVVTGQTPAPPELRQDDPTLPKGTVKQVDWAAAGANVAFNRTVKRNGEVIIQETFKSNYKPWQAVFLVGTQ